MVNSLRDSGIPYISLVAEKGEKLLGHIFFTPVELNSSNSKIKVIGLAPMAVAPNRQKQGIGSQLVKAGLNTCLNQGYDAAFVLGHPDYYPKFSFLPSVKYGIKSEYDVPDEVSMVLELKKGTLDGKQGTIKYREAFGSV